MRHVFTLVLTSCILIPAWTQGSFERWIREKEGFRIEPFMMVQFWTNYTVRHKVYDDSLQHYRAVDNRLNILLRRARLGFRAEPYPGLKCTVIGAYDLIGRDINSGLNGGANNEAVPAFGIWDAFVQWKISRRTEAFYLTGGYFRPQLGRENITSAWSVNSMDKAGAQSYLRNHLVGTGPGRAAGLNLGGILQHQRIPLSLNYNFGMFNPQNTSSSGNSTGSDFSLLLTGRAVITIGDPEMEHYSTSYNIVYFGERNGISLGFGGSWQGNTDLFETSYTLATDLLFNLGNLNLDADWSFMWREGETFDTGGSRKTLSASSNTGHFRIGYHLVVADMSFLEPTFMLVQFNGAMDTSGQADALALGTAAGRERTYDVGINWYLNKKQLKIMCHYTWRDGDAGAAGPGASVNEYFTQSKRPIRRGNWLGLGVNIIF